MKGIKNYFLVILIFSYFSVISQTNTGSPYSLNELGEINFTGNVSYQSMGELIHQSIQLSLILIIHHR